MEKRGIIVYPRDGNGSGFNTAEWGWTLTSFHLSDMEPKTYLVDKPGGHGSWDLSDSLTDGLPRYKDRTLTATLECSVGTMEERRTNMSNLINPYNGKRCRITGPGTGERKERKYVAGRVQVVINYHNLAHTSITITAVCDPWVYPYNDTALTFTATEEVKTTSLSTMGVMETIPTVTVYGGPVRLKYNGVTREFSAGTYVLPDAKLVYGQSLYIEFSGSGTARITYKVGYVFL